MSVTARRIGLVLLGLFALLLLVVLVFFGPGDLARYASAWASGRTGREVSVGRVAIDAGLPPRITLEQVRLANAQWGQAPVLFEADRIRFRLRILPLLIGDLRFVELQLDAPVVWLERSPRGEPNWQFVPAPAAAPAVEALPEERAEFPVLTQFELRDLRLHYRDRRDGTRREAAFDRVSGRAVAGTQGLSLQGEGQWEGAPLRIALEGASVDLLRGSEDPYPFALVLDLGQSTLRIAGTVDEPFGARGLDADLHLEGTDLAHWSALYPLPLPATPDYRMDTRLHRAGGDLRMTSLTAHIGATDLAGDLRLAWDASPPHLSGSLQAECLHLGDFKGLIGAPPEGPPPTPGKLFPDVPLNIDKLQQLDMDVAVQAARVEGLPLPLETLDAHVQVADGRLRAEPMSLGIAQGTWSGMLALDSRAAPANVVLDTRLRHVRLGAFFPNIPILDANEGFITGHVALDGSGGAVAEAIGSSDGSIALVMTGGRIDSEFIEIIGLDLAELLLVVGDEGSASPVRCAVAVLDVNDGIADVDALVLDTEDSTVVGRGRIDLRNEQLDLTLLAHPKDPSLLAARTPLHLMGAFVKPDVDVEASGLAGRAATALALTALAGPLAAVVPFIEPGEAEDVACGELLRRARREEER